MEDFCNRKTAVLGKRQVVSLMIDSSAYIYEHLPQALDLSEVTM